MILFSYLNLGTVFLLVTARTSPFSDQNDNDQFEESDIYTGDNDQFEESGISSELKKLRSELNGFQVSVNILLSDKGDNQHVVDDKLEGILQEMNTIKEFSEGFRNIAPQGTCRDNQTNFDTLLEHAIRNIKNVKEYSATLHRNSILEICRKYMNDNTIKSGTRFVTPLLNYPSAFKYCEEKGGTPFIPKTQSEFNSYITLAFENYPHTWTWYPLNDIEREGHLVLADGTDYNEADYKIKVWEDKWENKDNVDCATVDKAGKGSWSTCDYYSFNLVCQKI